MSVCSRRRARIAALIVLWVCTAFLPQLRAQDKTRKIDELMTLYHDYGQFNGRDAPLLRGGQP